MIFEPVSKTIRSNNWKNFALEIMTFGRH
jgi:hypothetical protein